MVLSIVTLSTGCSADLAMRDWLVVAAILGCLIIELLHPVLTRAASDWRDPTEAILEASEVSAIHEPARSPMADLFAAGESMVLPAASSPNSSTAPTVHTRARAFDLLDRSSDSGHR